MFKSAALVAVSLFALADVVSAQAPPTAGGVAPAERLSPADKFVAALKPNGATPRRADGHPDFSGTWTRFPSPAGPTGRRSNESLEPDQAVSERGAAWNKPPYKPEFWSKVEDLDFGKVDADPAFHCVSAGMPRLGPPTNIMQADNQLWFYVRGQLRHIPVDGRARDPNDADFDTYLGLPLGRWEGDTLVIESTGFTDNSWLGWEGYFHSNRMTLVERIRRDGDLLYWEATVTDPEVLTAPWTLEPVVQRLSRNAGRIMETPPCQERDIDNIVDNYFRG